MNIYFCGFWSGFSNNLFKIFFNDNYKVVDNINQANIIIVGPFVDKNCYTFLTKSQVKRIHFVSEPIEHTHMRLYDLIKNYKYELVFGCISNDINKNYYKYPLYLFYYDINKETIYNETNKYVKETNLDDKNFCCMINTHDNGKTRTPIYYELIKIGKITCPSKLFNNCSNDELNKIGNVAYLKKFLFNICSENFKCTLPGYITEKLMRCCLGGGIPIYFGSFDEIDEKIFNKNRIIFYNPFDKESLLKTKNFVEELFNNKEKLEKFYRQDVFNETANEAIMNMKKNIQEKILEITEINK